MLTKSLNYGLLQFQAWICIIFQSSFMKFKDQNHFLNYICFIFIHLANKSFPNYGQNTSYKTNNQFNVVHFEFLDLSQFLRPHPNRFYYTASIQDSRLFKTRQALTGNSAHTYARTPFWVRFADFHTLSVLKSSCFSNFSDVNFSVWNVSETITCERNWPFCYQN